MANGEKGKGRSKNQRLKLLYLLDVIAFQIVKEHTEVANVVVDCCGADGFSVVPPPLWVVGFLLLINNGKSVFSALLEFHDVSADNILCNFINCKNAHFVHTPPLEQL